MDSWLTNDVKELMFKPCLEASGYIDNRLKMAQSIELKILLIYLIVALALVHGQKFRSYFATIRYISIQM